jgi:exopolysaccharide biosynthesis polyprenyl glycosylphosphotransferase
MLRSALLLTDAVLLAAIWSPVFLADPSIGPRRVLALGAAVVLLGLVMCWELSLYRYRVCVLRSSVGWRVGLVAVALGLFVAGVRTLEGDVASFPVLAVLATFVLLNAGRAVFDRALRRRRTHGRFVRDLLGVGSADEVARIDELFAAHPEAGFRLVGYVGEEGTCRLPRLGDLDDAVDTVRRTGATGAVLAANGMGSRDLNRTVHQLAAARVPTHVSSGLWGLAHQRLRHHPVAYEPFLSIEPAGRSALVLAVKRMLDVAIASFLLVVLAPVIAAAALAIRVETPGPFIFTQRRVGREGKPIVVHKLRTMVVDAEAQQAVLRDRNERRGPLFKIEADPRVTRVGRWLRASSVDELPQLFDVVIGRLSLVGPRPALPDEVASFDDELRERRIGVRPGITGLWQVEARHNPSFEAYRHLDLFYADNWSLRLDLAILAATVEVVVADTLALVTASRRGASAAVTAPAEPRTPPLATEAEVLR